MQIKHNNSLGFKFWDDESSINFQPSSFSTFLLFHMYKQLSLITLHAKFQLHRYAALWHPPLQFLPRLPRKRLPDSEIYYRNIETVCIKKFINKLSSPSQKIGNRSTLIQTFDKENDPYRRWQSIFFYLYTFGVYDLSIFYFSIILKEQKCAKCISFELEMLFLLKSLRTKVTKS